MSRKFLLLGGLWLLARPVWGQSVQSTSLPGRVEAVLGGDNVLIRINGELVNVDLANISPPWDANRNWDQQAAARLAEILPPGTSVMVDPAWRIGDQLYAYVYTQNGLVNLQLLREGVSLPRGIPRGETLRQWYNEATLAAQHAGLGYWQQSMAVSSAPALPALPPRAAYWGLGGAVLVATLISVGHACKAWLRDPQRQQRQQQRRARRQLPQVLATHKRLQRQYQRLQEQMETCLQMAEAAVLVGKDDKARQALLQKRTYQQQAEALAQELQALEQQIESLRRPSPPPLPEEL
ncbi:MAG: hypothetical protein Q6J68_04820 [Thermostichales cyanobacterium SZTDM-1c_bins_54]